MITSRTNPEIKKAASLRHAKYRTQEGAFIAEGGTVINTLLQSGLMPRAIYATPESAHVISQPKKQITIVSDPVMQKLSSARTPSGIVAIFPIPAAPKEIQAPGLVLARVADPGNMGTLIRSAAAFGIKSVCIIQGADPWAPKVVQSSAGTIGMIAIHQVTWQDVVSSGHAVCGLVVHGGKKPDQLDLTHSLLVVGSEAHGIPDDWLAQCTTKLTLPMPGNTESLNAAVAGSIALYVIKT